MKLSYKGLFFIVFSNPLNWIRPVKLIETDKLPNGDLSYESSTFKLFRCTCLKFFVILRQFYKNLLQCVPFLRIIIFPLDKSKAGAFSKWRLLIWHKLFNRYFILKESAQYFPCFPLPIPHECHWWWCEKRGEKIVEVASYLLMTWVKPCISRQDGVEMRRKRRNDNCKIGNSKSRKLYINLSPGKKGLNFFHFRGFCCMITFFAVVHIESQVVQMEPSKDHPKKQSCQVTHKELLFSFHLTKIMCMSINFAKLKNKVQDNESFLEELLSWTPRTLFKLILRLKTAKFITNKCRQIEKRKWCWKVVH